METTIVCGPKLCAFSHLKSKPSCGCLVAICSTKLLQRRLWLTNVPSGGNSASRRCANACGESTFTQDAEAKKGGEVLLQDKAAIPSKSYFLMILTNC